MNKFAEEKLEQAIISLLTWMLWTNSKGSFSQRVRRLKEWTKQDLVSEPIKQKIEKLRKKLPLYASAYDLPGAHRTSNMLDRLMQRMDGHLFDMQYFHGSITSANRSIRSWALVQNFASSNPNTVEKYKSFDSPAERFNHFSYHTNWLENLLVSASRGMLRIGFP